MKIKSLFFIRIFTNKKSKIFYQTFLKLHDKIIYFVELLSSKLKSHRLLDNYKILGLRSAHPMIKAAFAYIYM